MHHPGHDDGLLWADWAGNAVPLAVGPVLRVDTAHPVDVPALAERVSLAVRPGPGGES